MPFAALLLLFGLWSGYWCYAQAHVRFELIGEREKLAARGFEISCQRESWGGYPFRFEYSCNKPVLRLSAEAEASAGSLLLLAQAYDPKHVVGIAEGPTRLQLSQGRQIEARYDRAVASLILHAGRPFRISGEVSKVSVADAFSATHLEFHGRPAASGATDIAVDGEAIRLTGSGEPPLLIDQIQMRARLTPNGTFEIQSMLLRAGSTELTGRGSLNLDTLYRLSGQINATTNDVEGLLRLAEPHLDIHDREKATLRALLSLLNKNTSIAISARNGELFIGPIKVAELVPLF